MGSLCGIRIVERAGIGPGPLPRPASVAPPLPERLEPAVKQF